MADGISRSAWLRTTATAVAGAAASPALVTAQPAAKLRVGLGMIEAHALGYYAVDRGYFAKAGLDVDLHQLQFGAIVAEAVAAGDLQIGSSNVFSLLAGHQKGIPFVIFAGGPVFDGTAIPSEMLAVSRDSPIRTVADLNGKTIGGISVGGFEQLAISSFVDRNGGDSTTLKWLQVTPSAMVAALEQNRIAAVDLPEPELSAQADRIRTLGNTFTGVAPRFLEGAWFTTNDWLAKNKDTARRFAGALVASGQWAMANPEAAATVLGKYVGFKEPRAKMHYANRLDPALVQPICDVAAKYKMLLPMKAAELVWDGR